MFVVGEVECICYNVTLCGKKESGVEDLGSVFRSVFSPVFFDHSCMMCRCTEHTTIQIDAAGGIGSGS